jgi:hypothetical protein
MGLKMNNYYNTNRLAGEQLLKAIHAAKSQEEKISLYFSGYPGRRFAPHQIKAAIFSEATPLTSIRRAITNLEQSNFLFKTDRMIEGDFGSPVHTWRLNNRDHAGGEQIDLFGG